MHALSRSSRMALWAAACALLLKAAVPMLASAAARLQQQPVGEVCSVYGVVAQAPRPAGDLRVPSPGWAVHSGDHCALGALALGVPPQTAALAALMAPEAAAAPPAARSDRLPDACARWVGWVQHGPPSRA
ncbi:MAG TPA: DUF2946 family protein [Albitalea sp.]|nr:DUF2946 family protein [Albitalea sp.]